MWKGSGLPGEGLLIRDSAACADRRAKKAAGSHDPAAPLYCRSGPRQAAADALPGGADPIALHGGGRRNLWRESKVRATGDMVRQAAFAFLMALQVRQTESPFLYM